MMEEPEQPERGWWKTLFDEVYLTTDARSVCDEGVTRKEIDLVCKLIPIRAKNRILDLCGGHGRHSIELVSRGFSSCTLVDYSKFLLSCAKKKAVENGCGIHCVRADARMTGMHGEVFDHVLILGNSLGYHSQKDSDLKIVSEAFRLLKPGGWLLADVTDGRSARKNLAPSAWHEIGTDIVVCRKRRLDGDRICAREMVLSKKNGLIRDRKYAIKLYDQEGLIDLFSDAGFINVRCHTDFSPHKVEGDLGFMNRRMLAVGQKK